MKNQKPEISLQSEESYCKFCKTKLLEVEAPQGVHSHCHETTIEYNKVKESDLVYESHCRLCKRELQNIVAPHKGHPECYDYLKEHYAHLDAKANQNYDLYNELREGIDYEVNAQNEIVKLTLAGRGIMEFPPSPIEIQNRFLQLEELDISNNPIDCLAEDLGRYKNLKILYTHACPLNKFPEILAELPLLEQLSIVQFEEPLPAWFIQRVFDGLKVRSAYSSSPELQSYGPLKLNASLYLYDYPEEMMMNSSNQIDNVAVLCNLKKQLQDTVTSLENITTTLKKHANEDFSMQFDCGTIFVHATASIMKEIINNESVDIWFREDA